MTLQSISNVYNFTGNCRVWCGTCWIYMLHCPIRSWHVSNTWSQNSVISIARLIIYGGRGVVVERYVVEDKKEGMKNVNMSICTSLTSFNSPRKIFPRFCYGLHMKIRLVNHCYVFWHITRLRKVIIFFLSVTFRFELSRLPRKPVRPLGSPAQLGLQGARAPSLKSGTFLRVT
jgi:hypothetical protein